MNKISIGATILRGYGFALRRIAANLGLSWMAALFYAVAAAYWLHQFCSTMLVSPHPGTELNDFALFDLVGLLVTTALGSAIIARALTGAALEPGGEIMTAHFAIAKREWSLFLSVLTLYVFIIAALFAVILLGSLAITLVLPMIGAHAQWHGITPLSAMNVAVAILAFAVIAMLSVRLGFFAAPVASAERSMSMGRAWSLGRGNSWRVFVVMIGLGAPVLLLWAAAEWALLGNDLTDALSTAMSPSHDSTAFYQTVDSNVAAIAGAWTLLIVVLNMLFAGAAAPAYFIVRDNAIADRVKSSTDEPALEPAFAGFVPRYAKAPVAEDIRTVALAPEVFTAMPEEETPAAPAEVSVEKDIVESHDALPIEAEVTEMPVSEPAAGLAEAEQIEPPLELMEEHQALEAPAHLQENLTHEHSTLAEETYGAPPLAEPQDMEIAADAAPAQQAMPRYAEALELSTEDNMEASQAEHHALADEIHAEPHVETVPTVEPAETPEAAVEARADAGEITPLPSHGDETESSQQNVPSEAA